MSASLSVSSIVPEDEAANTGGTGRVAEEVADGLAWWPHLIDTLLSKGKKSAASDAGRCDPSASCIAKPIARGPAS